MQGEIAERANNRRGPPCSLDVFRHQHVVGEDSAKLHVLQVGAGLQRGELVLNVSGAEGGALLQGRGLGVKMQGGKVLDEMLGTGQ